MAYVSLPILQGTPLVMALKIIVRVLAVISLTIAIFDYYRPAIDMENNTGPLLAINVLPNFLAFYEYQVTHDTLLSIIWLSINGHNRFLAFTWRTFNDINRCCFSR
jgi:hypothetical protein